MSRRVLSLPAPPVDRGHLLTAKQVVDMLGGGVSEAWVRRKMPHKVNISRKNKRWYLLDVRRYIEQQREDAS